MKRTTPLILLAALLATTACSAKKTEYSAEDGSVKAVHNERTDSWTITDSNGVEPVTDYDSMRVVELGEDGHPKTVCYFKGQTQTWLQYYSAMRLRSRGNTVDGLREGLWVFYYPDGTVQSEANFVAGREDGPYRVYRENGVPYYIGQYTAGERSGTWEVYDPSGELVERRDY